MIISSETIHKNGKDFKLEIVDGEDIVKTYRTKSEFYSCMANSRTVEFYAYCVPKLRQLRILYNDKVYLRTLLWTAKERSESNNEIRTLDRVYEAAIITTEYAPYYSVYNKIFKSRWSDYADVRKSAKTLIVPVKPWPLNRHTPYIDTFRFSDHDLTYLSNHPSEESCRDHQAFGRGGCLNPRHRGRRILNGVVK